jgi:hypothetical protein
VPVNKAHQRYLRTLFTRAEANHYPSHQILDRIEGSITDRATAEAYVDLILSEAERQTYPSLRMLDRANRIVTKLAVADTMAEIERELES